MVKPAANFVIRSRRYGYLCRGGFQREAECAAVFPSLAAARDAARAAAKLYGIGVEVLRATGRSWRETRDEQNARTSANRDALNTFVDECQMFGVLVVQEKYGRKYSY